MERLIQTGRKNWRLIPCALGAETGQRSLFLAEGRNDNASLVGFSEKYFEVYPGSQTVSKVACEVRTLDSIAQERGPDQIDLLKIDVEDFEFEVLKSAGQVLKKTVAATTEVSLIRKGATSNPLVKMLALLARTGFGIVSVEPAYFEPGEPWEPCEFDVPARRETKPDSA